MYKNVLSVTVWLREDWYHKTNTFTEEKVFHVCIFRREKTGDAVDETVTEQVCQLYVLRRYYKAGV